MEGLSAAASGIAIASIAIQLADSFRKLCDFCKSIKEAPEDIRAISIDLELLSSVLVEIANETQHVEPDKMLIAALNGCCVKVKTLTELLDKMEPGFASTSACTRKWTAFKAVIKHGELMKFQEALDRLKGTLLLVQQNQYSRLSRIRQNSLEQGLATITHNLSSLTVQQHLEIGGRIPSKGPETLGAESVRILQSDYSGSAGWHVPRNQVTVKRTMRETISVMEAFLGTIRATASTTLQISRKRGDHSPYREQDQYEYKTSYIIYPAPWLIRLGFQYGLYLGFLSSSTQGWKNTLKTFCPVPDDALIFEFCRQGNLPAVRHLLSGGHASVKDTDSQGYTPLHFAAENYHPELCEMLKAAGADIGTITHNARTPMSLAARRTMNATHAMLLNCFKIFRILIDSMDLSEEDDNGWEILSDLYTFIYPGGTCLEAKSELLLWILRMSSFELQTNIIGARYTDMLYWTSRSEAGLPEAFDLLLNLGGNGIINIVPHDTYGYAVLHQKIVYSQECPLSEVLARGPSLHQVCFDIDITPYEESPTSLAMYSSRMFAHWRRALVNTEVDLETFVEQELEQNLELHPGWRKENLLDLFAHGDRPDLHVPKYRTCSDCVRSYFSVEVQPYWLHTLKRIKERRYGDDAASAGSEVNEQDNSSDLGSAGEALNSSSDATHERDAAGNVPFIDLDELPSESESEASTSDCSATTPIRSDCLYGKHEIVCMYCWVYLKETGTRRQRGVRNRILQDSSADEDEFSPFHIHS